MFFIHLIFLFIKGDSNFESLKWLNNPPFWWLPFIFSGFTCNFVTRHAVRPSPAPFTGKLKWINQIECFLFIWFSLFIKGDSNFKSLKWLNNPLFLNGCHFLATQWKFVLIFYEKVLIFKSHLNFSSNNSHCFDILSHFFKVKACLSLKHMTKTPRLSMTDY